MSFSYRMSWFLKILALMSALSVLPGCATLPDDYRDPRDPWESYNRAMTRFNDGFDEHIYIPVAKGYKWIMPQPIDEGISNFFGNQLDFMSALNNLLQLKLDRAASDVGRVAINSTVGLLGVIDWASDMDLPKYREDFGQTLGYWGAGPGPYFVWPVLGPRTVRDSVGLVVDWYSTPVAYIPSRNWRWGLAILYGVDLRADLLGAGDLLQQAALDPYEFTRDAYLQKREFDIHDGYPPTSEEGGGAVEDEMFLEDAMFRDDPQPATPRESESE